MTTGPMSQCAACQRLRSPFERTGDQFGEGGPWCEAFPEGIPDPVFRNVTDHRQPVEGDHGLQWLALPGSSYPQVFFVQDQAPPTGLVAAAGPPVGDSGMVALLPSPEWAQANALPDGEGLAAADLHVTLAYFPTTPPADQQAAIIAACRKTASGVGPFEAHGFAVSLFNPIGPEPCVTLGLSGDQLADLHTATEYELLAAGADLSGQHKPWVPHLTLTYTDDHYMVADLVDRCGSVPFDRLRVAFADQVTDLPLGSAPTTEEATMAYPAAPCPPGQHQMPDGTCMDDTAMMQAAPGGVTAPATVTAYRIPTADGTPWYACAVVEGEWSNGHQMAPGALEWAGVLPASLLWQPKTDEHHEGSVVVGRIDGAMRSGPMVWTWGVFDDAGEYGKEAMRLVEGGFITGVSIMGDDIEEQDVELICPAPPTMMQDPGMMLMPGPDCAEPMQLTHHARLRTLTIVAEPNYPQCRIYLGQPPADLGLTMTAAAVRSHSSPVSESATWDAGANEKRLASPMAVSVGRQAYAWIDDAMVTGDQMTKEAGRFLHHDISPDGSPGGANMTACSAGIGVLNGGRGGTTIPAGDTQGVYDHLATHLRDGDREPPPLTASAGATVLTAAGYTITIPRVWPEAWFAPPAQAAPIGALHVTSEGQVFGRLAPANVAHRAFRASGQHVTAPQGIDYSEFQNKPALVASPAGEVHRINAGNITFGCGHMSPTDPRRGDPNAAMEHYDNSCSIAARVRVGEDEHGTWVAGGLMHDIDPAAVERMMACALSGDWQDGKLNAALLVPVEGFPTAVQGHVRIRDGAVVASSAPVRFVPAEPHDPTRLVLERLARSVGRDTASRLAAAKARVDRVRGA